MKKIIFRILGALSSALIITAVFVPFVSVTGFSQSLWQAHEATGTLYLPIMIIAFGAIGVIFFAINIKTELAYTSSGALVFFLITQTIPIIDQGTFKSLSVGYYFLAVGAVLTGLMAFLCNLKTRKKEVDITAKEEPKEISVINQLDKLYDNQAPANTQNQNTIDNVIQPLPVQPELNNNVNQISTQNDISVPNQNVAVANVNTPPVVVEQPQVSQQPIQSQELATDLQNTQQPLNSNANPVVSEFSTQNTTPSNPVVSEFETPNPVPSNPVVSEFSNTAETQVPATTLEPVAPTTANPVVSEFTMPSAQPQVSVPSPTVEVQQEPGLTEPIQQENSIPKVDVMADQTNNSGSNLDIFG